MEINLKMETKKIKYIAYSIGAILAFFFIILFIYMIINQDSTCRLVSEETMNKNRSKQVENFATSTYTDIANLNAYLKYDLDLKTKEPNYFLPLNMKSLSKIEDDNSGNLQLIFKTDCCDITFSIEKSKQNNFVIVKSIRLDIALENNSKQSCIIRKPNIIYRSNHHYKCNVNLLLYRCYSDKKENKYQLSKLNYNTTDYDVLITNLYVDSIEFELNGDPNIIKDGKFSLPAKNC